MVVEVGTAEQATLGDCFIFQEVVFQTGFKRETRCADRQCSVRCVASSAGKCSEIRTGESEGSA